MASMPLPALSQSHSDAVSTTRTQEHGGLVSQYLTCKRDVDNVDCKMTEDSDSRSVVTQVLPEVLPMELADTFSSSAPGMKDIFLDYDGTLREFEMSPELAIPCEDLKTILAQLNLREDLRIAFISGRTRQFLFQHLACYDRLTLVSENGIYICRPGKNRRWETFVESAAPPPVEWKDAVKSVILQYVQQVPGSFLEDKSSSCVWHYRKCSGLDDSIETIVLDCEQELEKTLREHSLQNCVHVQHGHKIIEVYGSEVNKGSAVRQLRQEWHDGTSVNVTTFCAGDDVPDEDMFGSAADAISVKVGTGCTAAKYFVDNPSELRAFLHKIAGTERASGVRM